MKTLSFCILIVLCTISSFGQSIADPSSLTDHSVFKSPVRITESQLVSIEQRVNHFDNFAALYRDNREDRCAKAQKMKTAGIVLASIGGALFIGGIALIAVGADDLTNSGINQNGNFYGTDGTPLIAGGVVCTLFGVGGMGAGIPLAIIGSIKSHKYCRGADRYEERRERSYMELSTKGNGLALSF